jgi:site-specific DNA-methyltransferase (adenine-specific)/modification methylase
MIAEKVTIGNTTLYCGDCLDAIQHVGKADALITDPVWPNNTVKEFEGIDAEFVLKRTISLMGMYEMGIKRAALIVNCDTDPTFIFNSARWTFFRVMWLRYAVPGHKGRLLNSANVAYLFGTPPKSRPGNHCVGGECNSWEMTAPGLKVNKHGHPCPRRIEHMNYVISKWSNPGETVIDPFMGSGTTGVACVNIGRKFIGIEVKRKYFDIACERIEQAYTDHKNQFSEVREMVTTKKFFDSTKRSLKGAAQ